MGLGVLVLGGSGTGKSYSIKNFDPDEVGIFEVEKTQLPFQKKFKVAKRATYSMIMNVLQNPKLKAYVIDDSQYLMANENFDRAKEIGYGKFTEMALHFRDLIHWVNFGLPDDVIVYFLHHTEIDTNTGTSKAKTVGKMLDNQLTVEGCFNIVLNTLVENGQYYFITQSDGFTTAKSPEGMFELKIPNDLKAVDTRIREYWDLSETEEES
ncbi:MAG: AAA family ATPase [Lachnospiraceae bacterium]|nr:AAA family ATPase [Lachnospiraceae bacterium]